MPELRTASRRADRAAAAQWREERRVLREEGELPALQLALVTDGNDRALAESVRAGGADVVGLLAPDPLESLVWAAEARADHGYSALDALAADAVDAACLDLPLAEACRVAEVLLSDGVSVVFARPQTPERVAVRSLLEAAAEGNAMAVTGLRNRAWPSIPVLTGLLSQIGRLSQLNIVGWPAGREARAELCDLVLRLCGDVVAVCASASAMPAHQLSAEAPVTLALLTAAGTTVMVSESPRGAYERAQLTFVGSAGRIVAGMRELRLSDTAGVRDLPIGAPAHPVRLAAEGLRDELSGVPSAAAGLGDLLAASRVIELAARSYERDTWVEA